MTYLAGQSLAAHPKEATLAGCQKVNWAWLLGVVRIMDMCIN